MKKIILLLLLLSNLTFAGYNIFIMKDGTEIKSSSSNSSSTLQKVKRGAQLEMVAIEGNWYKVSVGSKVGFVYKKNGMKIKVKDKPKSNTTKEIQPKKQTVAPKQNKKMQKLNEEWRKFKIDNMRDVGKAYKQAQKGVDGALVPLVNALENSNKDIRIASENSLIDIGIRSIKPLSVKTRSKIYLIKSKAVEIMGKIKSPIAVPYLERVIKDKSIETEVISALNKIGGMESQDAINRYNKSKLMEAKMDSIKVYEESRQKNELSKLGLVYGETKNNILDVAIKLVQFKKTNTAIDNKEYKKYRETFSYLVKKYDNALGSGSALQLLKDNGYSKEILK